MPSAQADLENYARYVSMDSEDRARLWLAEAWQKIISLAEMPRRFAVIEEAHELGEGIRDLRHYSNRIVYRVRTESDVVEVLRVWHGSKSFKAERDLG